MKHCSWCSDEFNATVSYQIYCSSECREMATKEKVIERNKISKRKKREKKKKKCSGGCGTIISIYNENGFCNICMINQKKVNQILKELRGLFEYEQNI